MDLLKSAQAASQDFLSYKFAADGQTKTAKKSGAKPGKGRAHHRVIIWSKGTPAALNRELKALLEDWQIAKLEKVSSQGFQTADGPVWLLQPALHEPVPETKGHGSRLLSSAYGRARDLCGSWLRAQKPSGFVDVRFVGSSESDVVGALTGFNLASYKFLDAARDSKPTIQWKFERSGGPVSEKWVARARALSTAMNVARHLTNLPAAISNPADLAVAIPAFFKGRKGLKIQVWEPSRLEKEGMGLLLGVGQGSTSGARLIHLQYRPAGAGRRQPLAFVGKGVTFDTGGLDIKPSSGMRLMKKDMAGSAAMVGLCHFVTSLKLKTPCDFYLPLAENAISDRSMRPGDILKARNGLMVEIDNTDAEGRLVMADAFTLAVESEPEALIDVATLTGAMRVAVGLDIAGFLSTSDRLAKEIEGVAQEMGEYAWRMPLLQKYSRELSSSFGDCKNSSGSGFGGAIAAALFLHKFVGKTPWLHFDVMSWNGSADGAISEGANAQCLQTLAGFLVARD